MSYIAVVDTETNWYDEVMSIGVVVAEASDFSLVDSRYYIFDPQYKRGGMYSAELMVKPKEMNLVNRRGDALKALDEWLQGHSVDSLFAYNATFDKKHLPEFVGYRWFDIMKLAAYRQHNHRIPRNADCYGTGRLKRDYGVEPIMRLLSGDRRYCERHNALQDAVDELKIMELLGKMVEEYAGAAI